MNMISTGAFLTETDASNKQSTLAEKFASVWEKKNAKAARAGGVSLMALSLAACGGSSSTTTDTSTDTTTTPVAPVAQTYTLTAGIDTISGSAADDTINAGLNSNSTQTLQGLDSIDGGAGTDTINVIFNTAATYAPTISNVEVINLTSSAAVTLDLVGAAAVATIKSTGSTAAVTINNIASPSASLTVASTNQNHTFDFANAAVTGSADAATVNVSGMTAGTLTVDAGIESLTLSSNGSANTIATLTATGADTLTITGGQDMTITAANTVSETIDASAATGDVTLTTNNVNDTTVTTGSGADSVTASGGSVVTETISLGAGDDTLTYSASLDNVDVLDGGDGTDTLVGIDADLGALTSTATTSNITNFEAITISDDLDGGIDVSDVQEDGINTINLIESGAGVTLVNAAESITGEAGTFTVNLGASAAANVADLNGTLTVVDSGTATDDSLVIVNKAANTTTDRRLDVTDGSDLTSTGYENVTFNTGTLVGANVEQSIGTLTITPDAVAANVSFTATGANGLDVATSITSTSTGSLTIDASGMTAQIAGVTTFDVASVTMGTGGTITATGSDGEDNFGASGAAMGNFASTINAGAGNDAIFTGTAVDTVNGGAGNDTIDVGSGAGDSADGGAGNDTIVISADANLTSTDTYVGGDGTDAILLAADMTDAAATFQQFSGFETLRLNPGAAEAISLSNFINNQGFTKIEFGAAGGAGATMAVTNAAAAVTTIQFGTTDAAGTAVVANDDVTLDRLVDTSADSLSIIHNSGGAAGTIDVLIVDDEETITITTNSADDDLTISSMNSADLTSLTLTGAGDISITGFAAVTDAPTTVDASALTGAAVVTVAGATAATTMTAGTGGATFTGGNAADTITGGSGVDVLTGGSGADVINAGAGADTTVDGGIGADTLTGGTGDDNFVMTLTEGVAATSVIDVSTGNAMAATATIAAGDYIVFGNGIDIITDFTAGGTDDDVNVNTTGAAASAIGAGRDDLDDVGGAATDDILFLSGAWDAGSKTFTIAADGAGADTLILDVDAGTVGNDLTTSTSMFLLQGVDSDDLTASDFI